MSTIPPDADSSGDDIDEVAVERATRGDRGVPLNRAEHRAAWQLLEHRGHSSRGIAAILGVSDRTVCRWRAGTDSPYPRRADAATRVLRGPSSQRRRRAA